MIHCALQQRNIVFTFLGLSQDQASGYQPFKFGLARGPSLQVRLIIKALADSSDSGGPRILYSSSTADLLRYQFKFKSRRVK